MLADGGARNPSSRLGLSVAAAIAAHYLACALMQISSTAASTRWSCLRHRPPALPSSRPIPAGHIAASRSFAHLFLQSFVTASQQGVQEGSKTQFRSCFITRKPAPASETREQTGKPRRPPPPPFPPHSLLRVRCDFYRSNHLPSPCVNHVDSDHGV